MPLAAFQAFSTAGVSARRPSRPASALSNVSSIVVTVEVQARLSVGATKKSGGLAGEPPRPGRAASAPTARPALAFYGDGLPTSRPS